MSQAHSLCAFTQNTNSCFQTILKDSWSKAVLSLPVLRERWVWTEPFPTLSQQVAVTAHAEHRQWQYSQQSTCSPELQEQSWLGQTAFCPRPFHAPNSTWREPVIYRKLCEFSSISLFLANHCPWRSILAVPCPASGNIVRSLSWKSPDIYSLFEEPSTPLKKRRNMLDWIQQAVN